MKRGRRLAVLLECLAALLLIVLAVRVYANLQWDAMAARRAERIREAEARDSRRPVLRGASLPGNAWDDYDKALQVMGDSFPHEEVWTWVETRVEDRAKEEIVMRAEKALTYLSRGTKRERAQYPTDWWDGYMRWSGIGLSSEMTLTSLALWKADVLVAQGRYRDAAETYLDLCQFGRDGEFNTTIRRNSAGYSAVMCGLIGLSDLIGQGRLSPADLKQVDRELAILESSFPSMAVTLMNESLWLPTRCLEIDAQGGSFGEAESAKYRRWRYAFSTRLLLADISAKGERIMRPVGATDGQSWPEAQSTFRAVEREAIALEIPLGASATWWMRMSSRNRGGLATMRLLRMACSFLTTQAVPDQPDPFGGRMLSSVKDGHLKIWSVGFNGVDDGGMGTLKEEDPLDLVIECTK